MGNALGKDEFSKQVTKECSSYFDQLELLSQGIKASALVQNKLIQQIVEEKQLEDEVHKQLTDNEGGKTEAKCGTMNVLSGEAETMNVLSRDVETAVSPESPRVVVRNFSQEALKLNEDCLLKQAETMILTVNSFRNKFEKVAYDIATSGSPETSLYRQMKESNKTLSSNYTKTKADLDATQTQLNFASERENLARSGVEELKQENDKLLKDIDIQTDWRVHSDKQAEDSNKKLEEKYNLTEKRAEVASTCNQASLLRLKDEITKLAENFNQETVQRLQEEHNCELMSYQKTIIKLRNEIMEIYGKHLYELSYYQETIQKLQGEKSKLVEEHDRKMSCNQETIQRLREEMSSKFDTYAHEITCKQEKVKDLQNEMSELLSESSNLIMKHTSELKCHQETNVGLKNELASLNKKICENARLIAQHKTEIRRQQENNEKLTRRNKANEMHQKERINKFNHEKTSLVDRHNNEIKEREDILQNMKDEHVSLTREHTTEMKLKENKVTELNEKNELLKTDNVHLQENIYEHEREKSILMESNEDVMRKCFQLKEDLEKKEKQHFSSEKKAKEALINIQTELDMNKKMVLELSNEVEQKNRQLYVPVQLYFPPSNDQTHDAYQQIKDILTGKFSSLNKGVAVTVCTRPEELSEYKASLVFCVHVSRLGEDVSNCVKGITLSPLKGLVILHHKEERALPQHGSDRVLTAPEYKHLGRIFDMAFWSGKGVYDCQMNTLAIKNIMIFLQNIHDQYLGKSQ